jgi:hypothetical protein
MGSAGLEISGVIFFGDFFSSRGFSPIKAGAEEIDSDDSNSIFFLLLPE